jgi:NTP pyrophosphatase (non-canonical NTP hydrolase)
MKYRCGGKLTELALDITKWRRNKGFRTDWGNVPEKLMLIVTELSEAMEAYRHIPLDEGIAMVTDDGFHVHPIAPDCPKDDKNLLNFSEELADTAIRLFDLATALDINLEHEIWQKMMANEERPHKHGKEC